MALKKRILICCEKTLFVGVHIVYSLNVNITPKTLTPDGESNLKHGYFGYHRRQLQRVCRNSV